VKDAQSVITKLRENAVRNFGGRPFIMENLEDLGEAVKTLAERPLAFKGDNLCPVCGGPLKIWPHLGKYCRSCLEPIYEYRDRLASEDGFGTCYI
jgi:hypothetical protein